MPEVGYHTKLSELARLSRRSIRAKKDGTRGWQPPHRAVVRRRRMRDGLIRCCMVSLVSQGAFEGFCSFGVTEC